MSEPRVIALALASGLLLAAIAILLARRGLLSMRYTLGWLFVAVCVMAGGSLSGLVEPVADALDVSPAALVLGAALAGLLAVTVQLSITVSGLTEIVRTLAESNALLEERLRRVERSDASVGVEVEELER